VNYEQVFEDVFPALYRYCHRLTGDADAAEDAAQEAFVRLYSHDVEGPMAALRVWLFRAATNWIRDRYRVEQNRRRLLEKNPVTPGAPPDPEREAVRREEVAEVRRVLDALDPRDRELLLMREEGFRYRDMAEAVGVSPSSVGTLLARAQRRFVERYETLAGGDDGAPPRRTPPSGAQEDDERSG
jgi:RNA polymerase sigma factor (sigma-70 family)